MAEPMPIEYAAPVSADHTARRLRQAVLLNAVCGPIMAVQWPAIFAGLYVWARMLHRPTAGPMSWADFNRVFPHLMDDPGAFVFYAVAGLAAVASAVAVGRRRGRWVIIVVGFLLCTAFPFGTLAGLPTALILLRGQSRAAYANGRRTDPLKSPAASPPPSRPES